MKFLSKKFLFSLFLVIGFFGFVKNSFAETQNCCVYYNNTVDPVSLDCVLFPIVKTTGIVEESKNVFCDKRTETDGREYFLISDAIDEKYYIDNTKYSYYLDKTNVLGAYQLNPLISSCPNLSGTIFVEVPSTHFSCSVNRSLSDAKLDQTFLQKLHSFTFNKVSQYANVTIPKNLENTCCVPAQNYKGSCHIPTFDELSFNKLDYNSFYSGYSNYFLQGGTDDINGYINKEFVFCDKNNPDQWELYPYKCSDSTQGISGPGLSIGFKDTVSGLCSQRKANNISFCSCTKDKSSCNNTQYDTLKLCNDSITSQSSLVCVELNKGLFQTADCQSLVVATQPTKINKTKTGTTNSDLLKNLRGDIENLNRLKINNVQDLLGRVIRTILGILGSIALAMVMYGGIMFMMSNGNSDKRKKAVSTLVWATLGVTIIFSSYILVNFVLEILK